MSKNCDPEVVLIKKKEAYMSCYHLNHIIDSMQQSILTFTLVTCELRLDITVQIHLDLYA